MKNILALFLVIWVLFPNIAFGDEVCGELKTIINYKVLEIPWDISIDEFLPIAHEKTGVMFERQKRQANSGEKCTSPEGLQFSVFGFPALSMEAFFSEDTKKYNDLGISFLESPNSMQLEPLFLLFQGLANALMEKYGEPIFQYVNIMDDDAEKRPFFSVSLPSLENWCKLDTFSQICKQEDTVWFQLFFNNIVLECQVMNLEENYNAHIILMAHYYSPPLQTTPLNALPYAEYLRQIEK